MAGTTRRTACVAAAFAALSLVAAACGGDDGGGGGGESTSATVDAGVKGGVEQAFASSTTTEAGGAAREQPKTMEEWEALWATERAAIVNRIKDNGWGKSADGTKLTGPEGFTIDLTKCPAGWSDTEGITDTSVKVGQAIAQSGTFAEYFNYAKSIKMLMDHYGGKGAIKDVNGKTRTIEYITKDDGYDPARTIPMVDEFLDSDKVFAVWTLGSPSSLKTYDKINQRCVPHPEAITGHAAWGDPAGHPWTTGAPALSYSSEAVLWGSFIEQHIDEFPSDRKIRVAALVMNNDFGKLYEQGFRAYVSQSDKLRDRIDLQTETIEAQAPTATDPMTTLSSKEADVFIAMIAATPCTQAITEAAQNGMQQSVKYLFQPQTCAGTTFVKKEKVGGDGSAANGWWIVNPGQKDLTDPAFKDDPYIKWATEQLRAAGHDPSTSSLYSGGLGLGFAFVQSVLVADELPGGLTRTNFILAQRSMDMTIPMFLPGVRFHMDGNRDAYFIEAGGYQQWDSAKQTWEMKSEVVDLDGKSRVCPWNQSTGTCG